MSLHDFTEIVQHSCFVVYFKACCHHVCFAGFIPLSLHSRLKRGNLSCTQRPAGLPLAPIKEEEDGVASTPPSAERTRAHARPPAAPHSLGWVDGAIREILKSPNNRATEPDGTTQSTLTSRLKAAEPSCAMIWEITPMTPRRAKQPSQHFFTI